MAPHAAATAGPVGSVSGHGSAGTARPGYVGDNKQTHPCPRPTRCAAVPGPGGGAAGPPAARSGRSAPAQPRTGGGGSRPGAGAQPGPQARYPVASSRRRVSGGGPAQHRSPRPPPAPHRRPRSPTYRTQPPPRCCRLLTFARLLLRSELYHRRYNGNNYTQLFSTTPLTKKMAFKL